MNPELDRSKWSGEGEFTQRLVDWFSTQADVVFLRVEDAPSTRSDIEYNFISNEIFVLFRTEERTERYWQWGLLPAKRTVADKLMTIEKIEPLLAKEAELGPPDYVDEGMIQYLYTQHVIPPYQNKGYKLIELVRIYEVGTKSRASNP